MRSKCLTPEELQDHRHRDLEIINCIFRRFQRRYSTLTSNRVRHGWSTKGLDAQENHLRQTVLPYPLIQRDTCPVLLYVDSRGAIGCIDSGSNKGAIVWTRSGSLRVGHCVKVERSQRVDYCDLSDVERCQEHVACYDYLYTRHQFAGIYA